MSESKFEEVVRDLGVNNMNEAKATLETFGISESSAKILGSGSQKGNFYGLKTWQMPLCLF
ncbi:hypothetical protein [Winogradskyella sp. R77965]|uniref:hypothetical protein n=1 Tax=Winogradskyella sp. R77965 TaxID=3093872 RepID=UPI0037DD1FE6